MRASWGVLQRDKRLLLFPLLSGIACLLVLASFAIPIFITGYWHPPTRDADIVQKVAYYATLFAYYFVNYFIITFFNVAIVACAIERLRGGEPTLNFGLREATNRLPLILGWALLSATVGLVPKVIEDRSEKVGQIVAGLLGMAWGVMSYLVVPTLVVEKKGPLAALKSSTAMLKRTWGEQLAGNFGFGAVLGLLSLPGLVLVAAAFYFGMALHNNILAAVFGVCAIVFFLVMSLIQSALQSIFQAAVYLYAGGDEGRATLGPRGFPVRLLQQAMEVK